jgi:hypothetical protein
MHEGVGSSTDHGGENGASSLLLPKLGNHRKGLLSCLASWIDGHGIDP